MAEINLQLEPAALESLIRRVVLETFTQLEVDRVQLGDKPIDSDPDATRLSLLKSREAAGYLNISERKLWDLTQRGEIPHIPIGRAVRYDPRDLQAWVEAQKKLGTEKEQTNGKHLS